MSEIGRQCRARVRCWAFKVALLVGAFLLLAVSGTDAF